MRNCRRNSDLGTFKIIGLKKMQILLHIYMIFNIFRATFKIYYYNLTTVCIFIILFT